MEYVYYKLRCRACGRKIVVEMFVLGTPHHTEPSVVCAHCALPISEEFKSCHPEAAADIEQWATEQSGD